MTNPSGDGIQTAAGCSGASGDSDEWEQIAPSGATETWSLDGFHYWMGLPGGWREGMPQSLDDLPNTELEVTDAEGTPIPGKLGLHKIRRQAVVLTWRADAELAAGSTLHSTLVLGPEDWQTRQQTLTVANTGKALELPQIQSDSWVTETRTHGDRISCSTEAECSIPFGSEEVTALAWRLGWTAPPIAPWTFEMVMTKGRTLQSLGPEWVGHRTWSSGSMSLQLEPADEYCFQVVGTDFSTGNTVTSAETCSAAGSPEAEVFPELTQLLACDSPPSHAGLRARWCEHNPEHEDCSGSEGDTAGGAGSSGGSASGGNGGGSAGSPDTGNISAGGSAGSPAASVTGTGGSPDATDAGGSGGSDADTGTSSGEARESRISKGGCWCSMPQAPGGDHGAFAIGGLVLLGRRQRRSRSNPNA